VAGWVVRACLLWTRRTTSAGDLSRRGKLRHVYGGGGRDVRPTWWGNLAVRSDFRSTRCSAASGSYYSNRCPWSARWRPGPWCRAAV